MRSILNRVTCIEHDTLGQRFSPALKPDPIQDLDDVTRCQSGLKTGSPMSASRKCGQARPRDSLM